MKIKKIMVGILVLTFLTGLVGYVGLPAANAEEKKKDTTKCEDKKELMDTAKKERDEAQKKLDDLLDEIMRIVNEIKALRKHPILNAMKIAALVAEIEELEPQVQPARDAAKTAKENYDQKVDDYIECLKSK